MNGSQKLLFRDLPVLFGGWVHCGTAVSVPIGRLGLNVTTSRLAWNLCVFVCDEAIAFLCGRLCSALHTGSLCHHTARAHTHIHTYTLKNLKQTFLRCQYICQEKKREQMSEIKRKMETNCGISHGTEAPLPWVRSQKG